MNKKTCQVVLVNPPFKSSFPGFPMGILYLASELEKAGHGVLVYDFSGIDISIPDAAEVVLASQPKVVGITGTSPSFFESMELASQIRSRDSDVCLVKGGCHEKFGMAQDAIGYFDHKNKVLNYVVHNETGEEHIVRIADAIAVGKWARSESEDGLIEIGPTGPHMPIQIKSPPHLPKLIPARKLLQNRERYNYHGIFDELKATQIMTYRGCPYQCSFCAIPSDRLEHNIETVEQDIQNLVQEGYKAVFIDDGTFTIKKHWKRAEQICNLMRRYDLKWACQTRIDQIEARYLEHMAATGCKYIYYGLESGSHDVLDAIKKGLKENRIIEKIRLTRELGMKAVTSFIFGVPLSKRASGHDEREDWMASVELIRAAQPDTVIPTIFAYYPGSPAWQNKKDEYLTDEKRDLYRRGVSESRNEVWEWFDDGYGAIHRVDKDFAYLIKEVLEGEIGDFLWRGIK